MKISESSWDHQIRWFRRGGTPSSSRGVSGLSWAASGLLVHLSSLPVGEVEGGLVDPAQWMSPEESSIAFNHVLEELVDGGYIQVTGSLNARGRVASYEYAVCGEGAASEPPPDRATKKDESSTPERVVRPVDAMMVVQPQLPSSILTDEEEADFCDMFGFDQKAPKPDSPSNPKTLDQAPAPPEVKPPKKAPPTDRKVTFSKWADRFDENASLIEEDDPVFRYGRKIGLPEPFIALTWAEFEYRYRRSPKTYIDWRMVFRKVVQQNWFKLWYLKDDGSYQLTTVGLQACRAHEVVV